MDGSMRKDWIDAEFEVVGETPRVELPAWFKAFMLIAVLLATLAVPFWRFNEAHRPPPPPVGEIAAPQSPAVR